MNIEAAHKRGEELQGLQSPAAPESVSARYREIRAYTEKLCEPLAEDDFGVQSMTEASPVKWHLAHTSWFFETFVLGGGDFDYRPFHPRFSYLFNSYYNRVGAQFPRARRGLLTRPTRSEVFAYRKYVDEAMIDLLERNEEKHFNRLLSFMVLGLHHEQQHQELLLTDLKHLFSANPLDPVYRPRERSAAEAAPSMEWIDFEGGVREIGHRGGSFHFDNEGPRHRVHLGPFRLASRPVTCAEYREFIEQGGYERPEWWLADGWVWLQETGTKKPLYWRREEGGWTCFTLSGTRLLDGSEPVCHLSYFEADAYARWAGARLPTEAEWEAAAESEPPLGNFSESGSFHPSPAKFKEKGALLQVFGDLWERTGSHYSPYPGFRISEGAVGEYNGKFMCNQFVLRGGSCATPFSHIRTTYRNFFPAGAQWQFSGIRLAKDL